MIKQLKNMRFELREKQDILAKSNTWLGYHVLFFVQKVLSKVVF